MTGSHGTTLAWVFWSLTVTLVVAAFLLIIVDWSTRLPASWGFRGYEGLIALTFSSAGGLITLYRPGHRVGQIFRTIGLLSGIGVFFQEYSVYTLVDRPGVLPGKMIAAWIQAWIWVPALVLAVVFLPLLFPTGQLLSRRWRFVGWLAALGTLLAATGFALQPGPLSNAAYLDNPVTVVGAAAWSFRLIVLGFAVVILSAILAIVSLFLRRRRAKGVERQQLKWFVSASAVVVLSVAIDLPSDALSGGLNKPPQIFMILALTSLPIACGIAILRYRLYDIDLVIQRTLVYVTLTAMLGLVYLGSVTLLQQLFRILTGQASDLAIVASTLAIAALLQPLRGRVQRFIDRYFYRHRYDAGQALANFGQTIRDEVDLEVMGEQLVTTVRETMQPAHVSLWLREMKNGMT